MTPSGYRECISPGGELRRAAARSENRQNAAADPLRPDPPSFRRRCANQRALEVLPDHLDVLGEALDPPAELVSSLQGGPGHGVASGGMHSIPLREFPFVLCQRT